MRSIIFSSFVVSAFFGCRTSPLTETPSEIKGDRLKEWAAYKANPDGFFAMIGSTNPIPANGSREEEYNLQQLKALNDLPFTPPSPGRKDSLTRFEAQILFDAVTNHPVAKLSNYQKYDPKNQGIGYCFGRAMTAHLEAIWNPELKLQNNRVRKLFAIGNLVTGPNNWRYHVTAIVKSSEGGWWAVDPYVGSLMTAKEWYLRMQSYNTYSKDMLLFHDEGMQFGPEGDKHYRLPDLEDAYYSGYFKDLLNSYRRTFRQR